MQTLSFHVRGITPLLLHNNRLANPLLPIVKQIKALTATKKKTDDIFDQIFRLEWEGGLYFDEKVGPFVPGINMDACIREGAKLSKRGRDVQRSLQTVEDKIPIEYKGPRTLEKMYEIYRDVRAVKLNGKTTTMRCRPYFPDWQIKFSVAFDAETINPADVVSFVRDAGRLCGLMEYRPRFGKFEIVE